MAGVCPGRLRQCRQPREVSQALPASDSAFGRSVQRQAQAYGGRSGFRLLPNSSEAFRARAELIRNAQSSIDLQYYIVRDGLSTRALVSELLQAADRGVRVRILLDDTTSDSLDNLIDTLTAHPNIQLRVFNPLHLGRSTGVTRTLGRLFNLSRQHRRMHNKLWLVDNSMAIVGGRNLGDEYFDAEPNLNFTDIDLLGVGPVAEQLGHSFDQYWNSALSRPINDFFLRQPDADDLRRTRQRLDSALQAASTQRKALYDRLMAYRTQPRLDIWRNELIWAHSQALWDAPNKVLATEEPDPQLLMTPQLAPDLNAVAHELILISAYFVPRDTGLLYLTSRADAGVSVNLLTNSLEATDVPAVHGGYAPTARPCWNMACTCLSCAASPARLIAIRCTACTAVQTQACTAKPLSLTARRPLSARSTSIHAQCCGTPKSACWSTAPSWRSTPATWQLKAWPPPGAISPSWKTVAWSGSRRTTTSCTP